MTKQVSDSKAILVVSKLLIRFNTLEQLVCTTISKECVRLQALTIRRLLQMLVRREKTSSKITALYFMLANYSLKLSGIYTRSTKHFLSALNYQRLHSNVLDESFWLQFDHTAWLSQSVFFSTNTSLFSIFTVRLLYRQSPGYIGTTDSIHRMGPILRECSDPLMWIPAYMHWCRGTTRREWVENPMQVWRISLLYIPYA